MTTNNWCPKQVKPLHYIIYFVSLTYTCPHHPFQVVMGHSGQSNSNCEVGKSKWAIQFHQTGILQYFHMDITQIVIYTLGLMLVWE